MNFLAHVLLAAGNDAWIVGSLIADFRPHPPNLTSKIHEGIELHHRVDSFADKSPHFEEIKLALRPEAGLYAAVVADICCDNLLISQWESFCRQSLPQFTSAVYGAMKAAEAYLPAHWRGPREDWLSSYQTREGLELALERVWRRVSTSRRFPDIARTFDLYFGVKDELQEPFSELFSALMAESELVKEMFRG